MNVFMLLPSFQIVSVFACSLGEAAKPIDDYGVQTTAVASYSYV